MSAIYQSLVDYFGNQVKTAKSLEVDQSSVSGWVRGIHGMSPSVAKLAEKKTGGKFTRRQLCPGFPWDDS